MHTFKTAVIRRWKGKWSGQVPHPKAIDKPSGGFVVLEFQGTEKIISVEHYETLSEIVDGDRYSSYAWLQPSIGDTEDTVLVGV